MKKDAVFINVSRGDLVDEAYLAEKLAKNELFAAGLDVYEYEPHINEQLLKLKNVVLAPHIGSATYKARMGMAQLTIDNVKQVLSGNSPQTPVPECRSILETKL
jgi:lactate dehydrogenase-like 2-hydroxyacid dehydrogenase